MMMINLDWIGQKRSEGQQADGLIIMGHIDGLNASQKFVMVPTVRGSAKSLYVLSSLHYKLTFEVGFPSNSTRTMCHAAGANYETFVD